MALSNDLGQLRDKAIAPALQSFQARIGVTFRPGALVAHRIGSDLLEVPLSASARTDLIICGTFVGRFKFVASSVDDGNGGALDPDTGAPQMVQFEPGSTGWFATGTGGNEITDELVHEVAYAYDDDTLYATDAGGTLSPAGRILGVAPNGHPHAGRIAIYIPGVPNDWAFVNSADSVTSFANLLAGTANGEGGSMVGLEDAGGFTTATDLEAALAELYQDAKTALGIIRLGPADFALATGAPLAIFANGASAVPGLSLTDSKVFCIRWNNNATQDAVLGGFHMPPDMDITVNAIVHFRASKTGATLADAVTFDLAAFNQVDAALHDADTDFGGTSSAMVGDAVAKTVQNVTRTLVAANFAAHPASVTITVKPTNGTLATDDLCLEEVYILYKRKLLTS
jgi:hypothetical protein